MIMIIREYIFPSHICVENSCATHIIYFSQKVHIYVFSSPSLFFLLLFIKFSFYAKCLLFPGILYRERHVRYYYTHKRHRVSHSYDRRSEEPPYSYYIISFYMRYVKKRACHSWRIEGTCCCHMFACPKTLPLIYPLTKNAFFSENSINITLGDYGISETASFLLFQINIHMSPPKFLFLLFFLHCHSPQFPKGQRCLCVFLIEYIFKCVSMPALLPRVSWGHGSFRSVQTEKRRGSFPQA